MRLLGNLREVEPGQRLLCDLHDARPDRTAGALLRRILGDAKDPRLDAEIVRTEFGLAGPYPEEALTEARIRAARLMRPVAPARRDFTRELTLTIDPADAQDFDDAVSIRAAGRDTHLLRVHIADVAACVLPGGPLDAEARRRGNSTYLTGQVIPMLPEVISTGVMSLSAGTPKRVLTISARVQGNGLIRAFRIEEGFIVSSHRLTYRQVQSVLDGKASIDTDTDRALHTMDELAQALRARRLGRGGLDLQVPETKITLAPSGLPVCLERRLQGRSHQIIEEFMILANQLACVYARRRGHPYIYRVHPPPDPVGVSAFRDKVRLLAPEATSAELGDLTSLRRWLTSLPPEPRTWRIHALFLRALSRAVYSSEDSGHFGLSLRRYGHFTSPIRRYPDLFNHRVVKWALRYVGRPVPVSWRDEADAIARACSATEERSNAAERELVRLKSLRWADGRLGSSYRGMVVATPKRGFFVELDEVPIEGFIPRLEAEAMLSTPGRRGRQRGGGILELGTPVIVQIARVDLRERMLIFALRAAGRRALVTDPDRMDPLLDATADMPPARKGTERGWSRPSQKRHRGGRGRSRR